jgi:flagellar protein FlaJ
MTNQSALQEQQTRKSRPATRNVRALRFPDEQRGRLRRILDRLTERNALESELYFVITYLYGLATSYCSLGDMFTYVAQSEFKKCARIFDRINVLAKTWHLGFVNALEEAGKQTKSVLLRDFLERFSQMLKTGELYDKFLMMEHEAYTVGYEAQYERDLKSMENLGNAYSAIITSVTFVAITLTLTQALMGSSGSNASAVSMQMGLALVATLLLSVLVLYIVSPVDKFVYLNSDFRIPKEFQRLRRFLPISIVAGVAASVLLYYLAPKGPPIGWFLVGFSVPQLPVGLLANRADKAIKARENAFPTFIRTLGTTAGITGYSTAKTIKLLLVRDFGVLSIPVRAVYARLSIGVDSGLCWKSLASECGSEVIRIFGGIYDATVSLGGDPGEIGKMISRNMIRRLVLRAKRIQVANGMRSMIYPLHVIECALLSFMTTLLEFLVRMISVGAQYNTSLGLFNTSMDPSSIAPMFNGIMILMAFSNAFAMKISEVSNKYRFLFHLAILLLMTGGIMIGVSLSVDVLFKSLFNFQPVQGLGS